MSLTLPAPYKNKVNSRLTPLRVPESGLPVPRVEGRESVMGYAWKIGLVTKWIGDLADLEKQLVSPASDLGN